MNTRIGIAALILLAACGTYRDAGNAPLALTPHLTLDLPLGTTDSVLVGSLRDATRLSDGRLALLDGDRNRLVLVDSTGRLLSTSGREGEGPGEYVIPSRIFRCAADSLFVWDIRTLRLSVLDSYGRFVRYFRPPVVDPFNTACNRHGILAAFDPSGATRGPPKPGTEDVVYRGDLILFSTAGDELGRITDLPLGQQRWMGTVAALGMSDDRIVVGFSSSPLLQRYTLDGSPVGVDSIPLIARPVTDSLYNAGIDQEVNEMGGSSQQRAGLRKLLATIPKPDFAPLYQLLQVTPDGTEWLVTSLPTDPVTAVTGRLPDGRLVSYTLPMALTVYEIGADYLLGKSSGADGESHLMLYRWELPTG